MTAPGPRAVTRALAVLAVLLGLLAMHGLASTHHAAASAAPHAPATSPEDDATAHHHAAVEPEAAQDAVALLDSPGAACDETCPDLATLCLAVLAGAALAMLLARRRSSPELAAPARPRGPVRAPPGRHARGPDPVRELCVSRT